MNGVEYFGHGKLENLCLQASEGKSYSLIDWDGTPLMGFVSNSTDEKVILKINKDEALYNFWNPYTRAFYDDRRRTMITIVYSQKGIDNSIELLRGLNLLGEGNKFHPGFDLCHEEDLFDKIENLKSGDVVEISNRNNLVLFSSIWNTKVIRYVHFFKSRLPNEKGLIRHNNYSVKELKQIVLSYGSY